MHVNLKTALQVTSSSQVTTDQEPKATNFVVKEEKRCMHAMRHGSIRERCKKAEDNTEPKEG